MTSGALELRLKKVVMASTGLTASQSRPFVELSDLATSIVAFVAELAVKLETVLCFLIL